MTKLKQIRFAAVSLYLAAALCGAPSAQAATLHFTGTVQQCTPTCASFTFLDAGSRLTATLVLDDAGIADGTWTGADVRMISITTLNPGAPRFGPSDPPNPATDNPFTIDRSANGGGVVVARGQSITNPRGTWPPCVPPQTTSCVRTSGGTTDGQTLTSGFLDLWLTEGLLANNGAVISLQVNSDCAAFNPPSIPAPCFALNIFERQVFVAGGDVSLGGTDLPHISVVPEQIDFGTIGVFDTRVRRVTLTNTGTANLIIGDLGATHPPDAPFSFSVNCLNQTLLPQGSCNFEVSAQSSATGEFTDTLDVPSNDPVRPSVQIDLHVQVVDLGGSVVGMRPRSVLCRNLRNGITVTFPVNGLTSWDCEAHGLTISRGDPVQMIVIGVADQ